MMKAHPILLFLPPALTVSSKNTVCFSIHPNPFPSDPALGVLDKHVDVFGLSVYAETDVSDAKTLHVAAVLAELLDNDEDGTVDDAALLTELRANGMLVPVFDFDGSPGMGTFHDNYSGDGTCAELYGPEIDPARPGRWGHDATVEEVLHIINCVGHVNVYPAAFELDPNSSLLTAAMDVARGGQFLTVPPTYPPGAWYHYDDVTCEYQCMAIEYLYWSVVSWMGIRDDPATCAGIANEWEPCSPALFRVTDPLMFGLITDPAYKLPQRAPDGNYCPLGNGAYGPMSRRSIWKVPLLTITGWLTM